MDGALVGCWFVVAIFSAMMKTLPNLILKNKHPLGKGKV
jgi:hypothetical protein